MDNDSIVLTCETTAADIGEGIPLDHINIRFAIKALLGNKFQAAETGELKSMGHLINLFQREINAKKV